ncbi:MAG: hypothetical protein ACYC8T_38095 [Myxococcaceae bacterium]
MPVPVSATSSTARPRARLNDTGMFPSLTVNPLLLQVMGLGYLFNLNRGTVHIPPILLTDVRL